jgi:hypothetical protein
MADACDPALPWSKNCFSPQTDVINGQGANLIGRLYVLEGQGKLNGASAQGLINSIIAFGYSVSSLQCSLAFDVDQEISLGCNSSKGALVENNHNCVMCKKRMGEFMADRLKLEKDAHNLNPKYTIQVPDPDFIKKIEGVSAEKYASGICRHVCLQCVAENLDQVLQLKISNTCDVHDQNFVTSFVSGMSLQAAQSISEHKQALKDTGVNIKNDEDITNFSIEMANTIVQITKSYHLNSLHTNALLVQNTTIDDESTSVVIANVKQSIGVDMIASLVSSMYTTTNIQTAIAFDLQQKLTQEETNFNDLVKTLTATVDTFKELLLHTAGKLIITVVVILLTVMLIFAAFFFFKPDFLWLGL